MIISENFGSFIYIIKKYLFFVCIIKYNVKCFVLRLWCMYYNSKISNFE